MILGLLTLLFQQNLAPWLAPWIKVDQRVDDVVFRIGAKIKMERMEVGVRQNSVPFDIDELRRRVDGNQTKYNCRSACNEPLRSRSNKAFGSCARLSLFKTYQYAVI